MSDLKPLLKNGDSVGLITPAGFITEEKLEKAVNNITSLGLKPIYKNSVLEKKGYLAGTDQSRLNELHAMYENDEIKAVWCVRGGYGTTRLLDKIDYNLIKQIPKPLIGYSDITALIQAVYRKTGIPGFHGVVAGGDFTPFTVKNIKNILFETSDTIQIDIFKDHIKDAYSLNSNNFSGVLTGGNLALTASLTGTPYEENGKEKILFLEDIGEEPYKIDRMLTQLISSGKFKNVNGIIFGRFRGCDPKHKENSLSLNEVIIDRIQTLNIPFVYGYSFGHIKDQAVFPVGVRAHFDTHALSMTVKRKDINSFFI